MKNIAKLLLAAFMALSLILVACSDGSSDGAGGSAIASGDTLPAGPTPSVVGGEARLILSWGAVGDAKAYQVYSSEFNNPETAKFVDCTTETNYVIPVANGTTLFVWVTSVKEYSNGTHREGLFGGMGTGTAKVANTKPAKVVGLNADVKQVSIKLSWNEIPEAASYIVQRKGTDGTFTNIAATTNLTNPLRSASYTISDLEPSTEYTFRVIAVNTKDSGPESDAITRTTQSPYPLTVDTWADRSISINDGVQVYEFAVPAKTTYRVQWNDNNYGDNTKTGKIDVSALWKDTKVDISWAAVAANNNAWSSPRTINNSSSEARTVRISVSPLSATPVYEIKGGTYGILYFDASEAALHTPPVVNKVEFVPPNKVLIEWAKVNNPENYFVYRSTSPDGNYSKIATIPASEATEYIDTGFSIGVTNYYAVSATIEGKEIPRSVPAWPIAIPTATPLTADTEYISTSSTDHMYTFAVTADKNYVFDIEKTAGSGNLSWDVYFSNGTKIDTLGSTKGNAYTTPANTVDTFYIVLTPTGLTGTNTLTYRIKIYDKASAKPQGIPVINTIAGAKVEDVYNVNISWSYTVKGIEEAPLTGFVIYRSRTSEFSGFDPVHSAEATDTSWTDEVPLGYTYYYRIAAKNAIGEGTQSIFKSVMIAIPGVPAITRAIPSTGFATPTSTGSMIVTWSSVAGATKYYLYRLADDGTGTTYSLVYTAPNGTTVTYTDTAASKFDTVYTYKIAAGNDYGTTAQSAAVSGGAIPRELTAGSWVDGAIVAGNTDWYKITVTSGKTYRIWWNDSFQGPTPKDKTLDVTVGAWYANGTVIFGDTDSGWNTSYPASGLQPTADGTVYVKVRAYTANNTGTYGVVFTEDSTTRPEL